MPDSRRYRGFQSDSPPLRLFLHGSFLVAPGRTSASAIRASNAGLVKRFTAFSSPSLTSWYSVPLFYGEPVAELPELRLFLLGHDPVGHSVGHALLPSLL